MAENQNLARLKANQPANKPTARNHFSHCRFTFADTTKLEISKSRHLGYQMAVNAVIEWTWQRAWIDDALYEGACMCNNCAIVTVL